MAKFLTIIGRAEQIDLPGVASGVPAKIDTGAFYSSIHCEKIKETESGGIKTLEVVLLGHPAATDTYHMQFTEYETVSITNSFGHKETRFQVYLRVKLGPVIFRTPFTLADRSNNLFPILVGRKILKNRFVVDVSKTNINRLKLKKQYGPDKGADAEDLE